MIFVAEEYGSDKTWLWITKNNLDVTIQPRQRECIQIFAHQAQSFNVCRPRYLMDMRSELGYGLKPSTDEAYIAKDFRTELRDYT